MTNTALRIIALAASAAGSPAFGQEERGYCAGYGMTGCTLSAGRVAIEATPVDWETTDSGGTRVDNFQLGRFALRYGMTARVEAIVGWTPFGVSDRRAGPSRHGIGDVTLGAKWNLVNPDGRGFSVAMLPFVNLPVGTAPIGAGKWSGGVAVPASWALGRVSLRLRPEIAALPDADGIGRHPSYTAIAGIRYALTPRAGLVGELSAQRNDDPRGMDDLRFATLLLGWNPRPDVQIEPGITAGLNRASPDLRLRLAVMRRF